MDMDIENGGSKRHQMSNEETLRRLAREAITAELVPAARPESTWGGNGTGALCDICGLSIPNHEIGFEVEFPRETARARSYHFHSQCFAAWELERHALEAGQLHKLSNGGAQATDIHGLSGADKAGSMPDCERNLKGGGESSS